MLSKYLMAGQVIAALCAAIYIMVLKLDIAELNTRIEVYQSNELHLKAAVQSEKEAREFTAGLLTASQEATNDHFAALQKANNNHISEVRRNADLQRNLDKAIRTRPVVAAADVNGRTASLLTAFWRPRGPDTGHSYTSDPGTAPERPASDGSEASHSKP